MEVPSTNQGQAGSGNTLDRWKKYKIELFPIANAADEQVKTLTKAVDEILKAKQSFSDKRASYLTLLTSNFQQKKPLTNKLTSKLWSLEFIDVLAELDKVGITIPAKKQKEWLELFLEERGKARKLQQSIHEKDTAIDKLVYALYSLNEEEIMQIKSSVG